MKLLYVNVHAVTRHYGGPEEGGWWYDAGQPLASVPVEAEEKPGHKPGTCFQCDKHRETGEGELCVEYPDDQEVDEVKSAYYFEGSDEEFQETAAYKRMIKPIKHLVPINPEWMEALKKNLETMFADQKYGNTGSVLGGVDVQITVDNEMARFWPEEKPRYE